MGRVFQGMISFHPRISYVVGSIVTILQVMGLRSHAKVTWLRSGRSQISTLLYLEILNPRAYFLNHYTTSINVKGNKRPHRGK